jgi:hypothetical protein
VHHGRDVARNATWGGKQACRGSGECFSNKKNVFRRCLRYSVKRDETLDGYGGATTPLLASTAALAFWPIIDIQQLHVQRQHVTVLQSPWPCPFANQTRLLLFPAPMR